MTTYEKMELAVQEYLNRLAFQNLQSTTIRNYSTTLKLFLQFLSKYNDCEPDFDLCEVVEAWKENMARSGSKPSSINARLTQLGIFFTKATKRSFPKELRFSENPVADVELVKVPKRPYEEILTDDQAKLLTINEPPKPAKTSLWPRNYAIIQLLCNEKIRNAELLDLTLEDIDFTYHEITIQNGKGRKQRTIDMSPLTEAALRAYLASGIRPAVSDSAPLFGTTAAHQMGVGTTRGSEPFHRGTTQWLSEIVERHVFAVCGVKNVRSHDLRHVGSRICLNAGTSMEELQGQLGHAQMSTTTIYSGKLLAHRRRESAQSVFAARENAAKNLEAKLIQLGFLKEKGLAV